MDYKELKNRLKANQFTWLITGVAGFIGSHLMEALLKLNQKVIGVDNFSTGYRHNIDDVLESISDQYKNNFTFYEGDICSLEDCLKVIQGVDYVLHQAALGSVPRSIKDPIAANRVNVSGFINILTAAKDNRVKRFVYASSSSVYGDSKILAKVEEQIGNQLSPYAVSKYSNELYAKVFSKCYNIEIMGLRYFNVFGARQDPKGAYAAVIPLWFNAMLNNEKAYINGDGKTTRDFCYVEDVVQANLLAALTNNSEAINQIYNIAVGEQITLTELFNKIRDVLHMPESCRPYYREFREGDIRHSLADISKARAKLKYLPEYDLEKGLRIVANWYNNVPKNGFIQHV
ncbi:MAG: SDR family oxidoreductase [Rickettsiales bacterium]|nr:SDR family oxidoreductase [Rickettsiales bacterium]